MGRVAILQEGQGESCAVKGFLRHFLISLGKPLLSVPLGGPSRRGVKRWLVGSSRGSGRSSLSEAKVSGLGVKGRVHRKC